MTPRVDATIAAREQGLKELLQTAQADVFFYACNGHGAWEAAIENVVPPAGKVLVPGTGHFSESWAVQAEALGRQALRTPWVEGLPIKTRAVADATCPPLTSLTASNLNSSVYLARCFDPSLLLISCSP